MFPAPRLCPVCQEDLSISRLDCRNCGTSVSGHYAFSGLAQLAADQLQFIETFVRCEGKFNRMEKEMGLSYPTLRSRLRDIIRALGFTPDGDAVEAGISEEERAGILDRIARGELTAEEAMSLLETP
jgi:hypothetical protein